MRKTDLGKALVGGLLLLGLTATRASATSFSFTQTISGYTYSASADFTAVNIGGTDYLQVVLTNTGDASTVPSNVLTAVFWDGISGLTSYSAYLNSGSSFVGNTADCGATTGITGCVSGNPANVGGEFGYAYYKTTAQLYESGISSAGLGIFNGGTFSGPNLEDPTALDGLNFGLVTGIAGTANSGVTSVPLIQSSVVFLLTYTGDVSALVASGIQNVVFQYGTGLNEFNSNQTTTTTTTTGPGTTTTGTTIGTTTGTDLTPETPEPASMLLLGTGLVAVAARLRRRRTKDPQIQ